MPLGGCPIALLIGPRFIGHTAAVSKQQPLSLAAACMIHQIFRYYVCSIPVHIMYTHTAVDHTWYIPGTSHAYMSLAVCIAAKLARPRRQRFDLVHVHQTQT